VRQVLDTFSHLEVERVAKGGFGSQRPAFFEILFDAGALVIDVD
jgi:hypothetical protein